MPPDEIRIPDPEYSRAVCDQVLGHYLGQWGQLELEIQMLFTKVLGLDHRTASIVFNSGINLKNKFDIIQYVGLERLQEKRHAELLSVISKLTTANTKRNRIVHGTWQLEVLIETKDKPRTATWKRFRAPADLAEYKKMYGEKDAKSLAKHAFSLEDIDRGSNELAALAREVDKFTKAIVLMSPKVFHPIPIPDWP